MTYTLRSDPRQLDLVDWLAGRTRKSDPRTSAKAASRVNVKRLNRQIMAALKSGPMTTEEIALVIRRRLQSITPRMAPLVQRGLVRNSGKTRKGSSGRERIVWELVSAEEAKLGTSGMGEDTGVPHLRQMVAGASPHDGRAVSDGPQIGG